MNHNVSTPLDEILGQGVQDRRTSVRRRLTPTGEIIVEVPFTQDQVRALLDVCDSIDDKYDDERAAIELLRSTLAYCVAQATSGLSSAESQNYIDTGRVEHFDTLVEHPAALHGYL